MGFKLGKRAPRFDVRTLRLEKYLAPNFSAPAMFDYTAKVPQYPMWLNDQLGDCTCAARAGLIATWTANCGSPVLLSDQQVLADYNMVNGGADNGAVEIDVLKAWSDGMSDGHKLAAYGDIGIQDMSAIKAACWLCEGLYLGLNLPVYCLNSTQWLTPSNMLAGGHAVFIAGHDGTNFLGVSWGQRISISEAFLASQCDEIHFCLSQDQLNGQGIAASGVDLVTMQTDIETVGQLDTPPIVGPSPAPGPGPTPTPTPTPTGPTEAQVQSVGDQLFDAMASALSARMIISGQRAAQIVESGKPAYDKAIKALYPQAARR